MAQSDLVALARADRRDQERANRTRQRLYAEVRRAVLAGEWKIIDVAELLGVSRETVRKIVHPPES